MDTRLKMHAKRQQAAEEGYETQHRTVEDIYNDPALLGMAQELILRANKDKPLPGATSPANGQGSEE
jgi:hypothetical protein